MIEVGAGEAKGRVAQLRQRFDAGARVVARRRDKAVARLLPGEDAPRAGRRSDPRTAPVDRSGPARRAAGEVLSAPG